MQLSFHLAVDWKTWQNLNRATATGSPGPGDAGHDKRKISGVLQGRTKHTYIKWFIICSNKSVYVYVYVCMYIYIYANGLYPTCLDVIDLEFDRNLVEFPILRAMQAPSFSPCAGASSAWAAVWRLEPNTAWYVRAGSWAALNCEWHWTTVYCTFAPPMSSILWPCRRALAEVLGTRVETIERQSKMF
jgi:hypothetical protein